MTVSWEFEVSAQENPSVALAGIVVATMPSLAIIIEGKGLKIELLN